MARPSDSPGPRLSKSLDTATSTDRFLNTSAAEHKDSTSYRGGEGRRFDLDNLRTFLTALVIVHHTAIAYGGGGGWKFRSRCLPPISIGLTAFNGIDQTFFMGTFFYLSGRFARQALSKSSLPRTRKNFVKSRLLRLALPAVMYTLIAEPSLTVLADMFGPDASPEITRSWRSVGAYVILTFWAHWINFSGICGPVWYLALLTIFDIFTVLLPPSSPLLPAHIRRMPPTSLRAVLLALTILSSFLIRLYYPVGKTFVPLNVQPAYIPQYILAYTWGHASFLNPELTVFRPFPTARRPAISLIASLGLSVLGLGSILALSVSRSPATPIEFIIESMLGGPNILAFVYEVWNELSFATIAPAVISTFCLHLNILFRLRLPFFGQLKVARYSYAAFLVHPPVSLAVELAVDAICHCSSPKNNSTMFAWFGPWLMTLGVGAVNVIASWATAWVTVECLPLVRRIIDQRF